MSSGEHTIVVAFSVMAADKAQAEAALTAMLPRPGTGALDSWWVAEDDRHDRSDLDSAVFVHPGAQQAAWQVLHYVGLSEEWNRPSPPEQQTSWEPPEQHVALVAALREQRQRLLTSPASPESPASPVSAGSPTSLRSRFLDSFHAILRRLG